MNEKFDRSKHTKHLTPGQFAHFEMLEAEAEEFAEKQWPGKRYGYSTEQVFTDPAEWLNWKLFRIVEQCEGEIDEVSAEEQLEAVITPAEIAATWDVKEDTVRDAAQHGWIPARKSGATWLIRRTDAEARWGKRDK